MEMFFSFTRRDANSCSWTRRHASVHAKRVRKKQKLVRQAGSVHNKKKSREKRKISLKDFHCLLTVLRAKRKLKSSQVTFHIQRHSEMTSCCVLVSSFLRKAAWSLYS